MYEGLVEGRSVTLEPGGVLGLAREQNYGQGICVTGRASVATAPEVAS